MADVPIQKLVEDFLKRGGTIDKSYLHDLSRGRPALVYMKGWFGGRNLRVAINKAISEQ
jgi:hypothetical protein